MEWLSWVFFVLTVATVLGLGAYAALFSRDAALRVLRYRKAVFRIGFSEWEVRAAQVLTSVVGVGLFVVGVFQIIGVIF